jgi:hypothetical protein
MQVEDCSSQLLINEESCGSDGALWGMPPGQLAVTA